MFILSYYYPYWYFSLDNVIIYFFVTIFPFILGGIIGQSIVDSMQKRSRYPPKLLDPWENSVYGYIIAFFVIQFIGIVAIITELFEFFAIFQLIALGVAPYSYFRKEKRINPLARFDIKKINRWEGIIFGFGIAIVINALLNLVNIPYLFSSPNLFLFGFFIAGSFHWIMLGLMILGFVVGIIFEQQNLKLHIQRVQTKINTWKNEGFSVGELEGMIGGSYFSKPNYQAHYNSSKSPAPLGNIKPKNFCAQCGKKLSPGYKYCLSCGHKVS
jgi:hypothetical protein